MKNRILLFTLLFLFAVSFACAQTSDNLRQRITQIIEDKNAIIGVAVEGYNGKDTLSLNGNRQFPLQSVFKFHIALAVLKEVDKGKLSLDQDIKITKEDLMSDLYSPIRNKYPDGRIMKLSEILRYTVAESDNVGCDLLLNLIGGPQVVEKYLHDNGIKDIAIKYNEKLQQSNWQYQFENWTTPKAANKALIEFYQNKNGLLSKKSHDFLWKTMKATKTGQKSIRGQLPENTVVAHKTGHSGKNQHGITGAINDIGVVFLPGGKYFYLSIFVNNSKEKEETNQKIIADIARVTWEYFTEKQER